MPYLRDAWKNVIVDGYPGEKETFESTISNPAVSGGVSHGIFLMSKMFLDEGEKIISPNKRWENYDSILTLQSGIDIANFKIFEKDGPFNIGGMLEEMEQCGREQEKVAMILNFPNNPTGYICSEEELSEISNSIIEYCSSNPSTPVVVLCDDAYDRYVYVDGYPTHSIFYELANKEPNLIPIKLDGPSKYLLMYGARVGFMTLGMHDSWFSNEEERNLLHAEWNNKVDGMIRTTVSNCNRFSQEMAFDLLNGGEYVQTKEKT